MIGWIELLKEDPKTEHIAKELSKDVDRLNVVTDRFSKIGSQPKLEKSELINIIEEAITYFDARTGEPVKFEKILPSSIQLVLSRSLFEWVIENLIKNALDAMEGKGTITVSVEEQSDRVYIDISDTGKGIPQSQFKSVFQPGYTSKKRGWGLGLSLSKRIIKEYHKGKIYVLKSEIGKGTTFRISLKKTI
jgi:signal transduction histidine kinase